MRNLAIISLLLITLLSLSTLFAQTDPLPVPTGASGLTENTGSSFLTLLAPVNEAQAVSSFPVFKWTRLAEVSNYSLIIKREGKTKFKQAFEATAICIDNICTVDLATVPGVKALKPGKSYKWRVKTDAQNTARHSFTVASVRSTTFTPTMTPDGNFQTPGTPLPTSTQMPITNRDSVDVNTLAGLISAIATCGIGTERTINLANDIYSIGTKHSNVSSDGYNLGATGLPPVQCTLIIEGNGSTIQRGGFSIAEKFRIFTVLPTGNLTIRYLTVKGGSADATGGAGILNHRGSLNIFDSTITQNQIQLTTSAQTLGAGIYTFRGNLFVTRSTISNNVNQVSDSGGIPYGDGGGIALINDSGSPKDAIIQSSNITNNTASRNGGAISFDNFLGTTNANANCFISNISSTFDVWTNTYANARWSWWGAAGGPNSSGADTTNSSDTAGYLTTQPSNCTALIVPTPTPTFAPPTVTPTPTSGAITLASYGINLLNDGQSWSAQEQTNLLVAANKISSAFSLFGTIGNTLPDKFKTVMGANVTFLRLASSPPPGTQYSQYYNLTSSGECQVFDPFNPPVGDITTIAVACRGDILDTPNWPTNDIVTEYAAVHELGHVLDIRSGIQLRGYVGSNYLFLADGNITPDTPVGERIMGVSQGSVWLRGQRGWGSVDLVGTTQSISKFQQNPENSPVEATADMFLNWVYRRTSDNAPTGLPSNFDPLTNDVPMPIDARNYPQDGTWEGFKNIKADGTPALSKPGNARYWWMEGTLDVVFRNHSWK